jgi:hypothetical protein
MYIFKLPFTGNTTLQTFNVYKEGETVCLNGEATLEMQWKHKQPLASLQL